MYDFTGGVNLGPLLKVAFARILLCEASIFPFHSLFLRSEPKTSLEGKRGLFSHIIWNSAVRRMCWCFSGKGECPDLPLAHCQSLDDKYENKE